MLSLYKLDEQLERLIELEDGRAVDGETGEIFNKEDFDSLKLDREKKIENCLLYYKNLVAESKAIADEVKALNERKARNTKRADWLKNYVNESLNGEKFHTARVSASHRKSTVLEFNGNIGDVPREYLKFADPTIDKAGVKKALKDGAEIKGFSLVDKDNLIIK